MTDNAMAKRKKDKSKQNYLQSITHKSRDYPTRTPLKSGVNSGAAKVQ